MERDFPIWHPAASDYDGTPYEPIRAPYGEDFPKGHPARDGGNIGAADTPDGRRAALLEQTQDLEELAECGALPLVIDEDKRQPIALTTSQLVSAYELRAGLIPDRISDDLVEEVIHAIIELGYTPERAAEILQTYCTPVSQK